MSTPDDVAQRTLDNHAIRDHWKRTGEQIRDLLVEAIEMDRAERIAVEPHRLDERHILGLRQLAAEVNFEGGTAVLDHSFGYGGLVLSLTVTAGGQERSETIDLRPMVQQWVTNMVSDMSQDVPGRHPGEEINQ